MAHSLIVKVEKLDHLSTIYTEKWFSWNSIFFEIFTTLQPLKEAVMASRDWLYNELLEQLVIHIFTKNKSQKVSGSWERSIFLKHCWIWLFFSRHFGCTKVENSLYFQTRTTFTKSFLCGIRQYYDLIWTSFSDNFFVSSLRTPCSNL